MRGGDAGMTTDQARERLRRKLVAAAYHRFEARMAGDDAAARLWGRRVRLLRDGIGGLKEIH